jgi:hypothetical protein
MIDVVLGDVMECGLPDARGGNVMQERRIFADGLQTSIVQVNNQITNFSFRIP